MIERTIHGEIHELRLNRPPANALSPELLQALAREVRRSPEQGARALVLSGSESVFSAGLDVLMLAELDREWLLRVFDDLFDTLETLAGSTVPVAAAITGHAIAGGAVLALCCDRRVMAEGDFSIGINEVRIGIPVPKLVADLAVRVVGLRAGEALCVSGRLLSPSEALSIGLVDELAPTGRAPAAALHWCEEIIEAPAEALKDTRSVFRRDLAELIRNRRGEDSRSLAGLWFRPELQNAIRDLAARLRGKKE